MLPDPRAGFSIAHTMERPLSSVTDSERSRSHPLVDELRGEDVLD